jgi:hypothetical protein
VRGEGNEAVMPRFLIEIQNGTVMNVDATPCDVDAYVIDVISEGSAGDLKRYLANVGLPVEIDGVAHEDDSLM